MNGTFGHHFLQNRYRFKGRLILKSPLRLSSGQASDETDAPLMRTRDKMPYIPGTSLRGAIRSELERTLAGSPAEQGLKTCVLFSEHDSNKDCNKKVREFQNERQRSVSGKNLTDEELAQFAESKLCDVCKLFGCTIFASRLIVEDAYPEQSEDQLKSKLIIRDGVGIDRDTGVACEGVKFDYEVMEPGPAFTFRMQVENVSGKDSLLVNLILALLRGGLYIGGKRAAGLGMIALDDSPKNKLAVTGFENAESLRQALSKREDPHKPLQWKDIPTC